MKIDFTVGENERHEMELSFDQGSGDLTILMDGAELLQDSPPIAAAPVRYELHVGNEEKHTLALQVAYSHEDGEPRDTAHLPIPRLSLMVTALTQ